MNQLLDKALKAVSELPEDQQNEIARLMLDLAHPENAPEAVAPSHLDGVVRGLAQARRGEFANDAEIARAFRRFD